MSLDPIANQLASSGVSFAPQIAAAARRHGLDPDLLAAVAAQETGGPDSNTGHNVLGDGGHGHGVFQIDDRWHPFASTAAAMDPAQNADYAAGMLSGLLKRYGGNVREALCAYNSGSPMATGTKTQWSDGADLGYADSVMRHYGRISGVSEPAESLQSQAVAETPSAVASTSALWGAARRLPLPPISLPSSAHARANAYHPQATDYVSFFSDDNDEKNS